jgi:biopolymer transport protein ExbD
MSDINVTPLVDVMLVLVVIFIITAPLLASSIRLDLPQPRRRQRQRRAAFRHCGGRQGRPGPTWTTSP